MHSAVILLGGNTGDVISRLKDCIEAFEKRGYVLNRQSQIYTSGAWGFESDHLFYNQLLVLDTKNPPLQILADLTQIERELGRIRTISKEYADRTIDIDILFYDSVVLEHPDLSIPHPRLHLRKFCLVPLMELMADFVHPIFNKTIRQLSDGCPDNSLISSI